MITRRFFGFGIATGLAAPSVLRAAGVQDARSAAERLDQLHAVIIQKGEDIVLRAAPRGRGLNRAANIKSCSKSILALLLGTAVSRGEIASTDATLQQVAPALIPQDATEDAGDTTMAELVTLRGGLQSTSGANYGAWVGSRNWVGYVLRQPRVSANGGRMIYSTGTTHVLGAAIATATGKSLVQLARERIGEPLGIEVPAWTRDPQGFYFGGNEMALTPEAMLRVAVMVRDGGAYGGQQIIDAGWMARSLTQQTHSPFSGLDYGYGWFLSPSGWVIARGYGGQIIAAHRGQGLAVAITSDTTRPARSEGYFGDLMDLLDGPILSV